MGGQKKQEQVIVKNYNEDRTAVKTPTAIEKGLEEDYLAMRDWKKAGDYRKGPPGMISGGRTDPAFRQKKREGILNDPGTGIFAMGAANANPTALAMAKSAQADEFDRDSAAAYQQQLTAYEADVSGKGITSAQMNFQRENAALGASSGIYGAQASRPSQGSPWASIIGGALGAFL